MGSTNFPLSINTSVSGAGDAEKLASAMNNIANSLDKATEKAKSSKTEFDQFAARIKEAIQNPLQAAGNAAEAFLTKIGPIGAGLSLAGAAAAVAGKQIFDLVSAMGKVSEQQINAAERIGVSVGQYQQFSAAAQIAGVNIGALEGGMRKLSEALAGNAEDGEKGKRILKQLGVNAFDAYGQLRPMASVITEIGAAIAKLPNIAEQQRAITALFGRGGAELLPLFKDLPRLQEEVKALGVGLNDNLTKELSKIDDEIDKLDIRWSQLKKNFAAGVAITVRVLSGDSSNISYEDRVRMGLFYAPGGIPGGATDTGVGLSTVPAPNRAPTSAQADALITSLNSMWSKQAWDKYSSSGNSVLALEARLAKQRQDLKQAELDHDIDAHKKAISEIRSLEEQIKLAKMAEGQPFFVAKDTPEPARRRMIPSLYGNRYAGVQQTGEYGIGYLGTMSISEKDIAEFNAGGTAATAGQTKALADGIANATKQAADLREQSDQSRLQHQIRMIELLSGPGGEITAIQQIYELRVRGAKTAQEAQEAEYQRQEAILALHKQQVEQYVSLVQGATNALLSGGGGLSSFLKSQGIGMLSQISGNFARLSYDAISKVVPHAGEGTMLGKLLAGTPFGADPLKAATDANTLATIANTQALARASAMSASGGGGSFGGILGDTGATLWSNMPGYPYVMNSIDNLSGGNTSLPLGWSYPELNGMTGVGSKGWGIRNSNGSLNKWGTGAAVAAGGFGVYEGIKMGGGKGALTAVSSAAMTAAALDPEPISKGILMAVGFASALATSIFGDPKAKRATEISDFMNAHRYSGPDPVSYSVDMYGRATDYDMRGNLRPIIVQQTNNINALDTANFDAYLSKNADTLNRGVARAIDSGGAMVPKLAQALNLA